MTIEKLEVKTTLSITCTTCHGDVLVPKNNNVYIAHCWYCGSAYQVDSEKESLDISQIVEDDRMVPYFVLMRSNHVSNPIYIVTRNLSNQSRSHDDIKLHMSESTCPINYFGVSGIIQNGDSDPHGVFQVVKIVEDTVLNPREEEGSICDLFPEIFDKEDNLLEQITGFGDIHDARLYVQKPTLEYDGECYRYLITTELGDTDIVFQRGGSHYNSVRGVSNELIIAMLEHRIKVLQSGPNACPEYAESIPLLSRLLTLFMKRTRDIYASKNYNAD